MAFGEFKEHIRQNLWYLAENFTKVRPLPLALNDLCYCHNGTCFMSHLCHTWAGNLVTISCSMFENLL